MLDILKSRVFIYGSIVFVLVIIGLVGWIKILEAEKESLSARNETLTNNLRVSNLSISDLKNSIRSQNIAVDKFKTEADDRVKKNEVEKLKAMADASTEKRKAAELLKRTAAANVDRCTAADLLIMEEIENATK